MGLFSRDFGVEVGEKGTTFHHMYIERNSGDVLGKKKAYCPVCVSAAYCQLEKE